MTVELSYFQRLEPRPRDNNLTSTLAAEVRDPAWFLARQWQMGEFNAEDAGSLAFIQTQIRTSAMPRWIPKLSQPDELAVDPQAPLERQTLREPFTPDLGLQVELGHDFADFLRQEVVPPELAEEFLAAFRAIPRFQVNQIVDAPKLDPVDPATERFLRVCAGRTLNGYELYVLGKNVAQGSEQVPPSVTTIPALVAQVKTALARLVARVGQVFGEIGDTDPTTWTPDRLEYRLRVVGTDPSGQGNATLDAFPDSDGEYEWFSFDVFGRNGAASEAPPTVEAFSMIPARVEFDGMPATRFWALEDSTLAIPDIAATDLDDILKMLVSDFMLVHSNDWFVLPFAQEVGTLAKTDYIVVHDTFGKMTLVERADKDAEPGTARWTMFSTTDPTRASGLADHFVLPPSPGAAMQLGTVLEDVRFGRDEMANMAFGIERVTTSRIGESRSGRERDAEIAANLNLAAPEPTDSGFPLRYQVASEVPANWFPLFPKQVPPSGPAIVLEVGRAVKNIGESVPALVEPLGKILQPDDLDDYQIQEEEIPRTGLQIERVVYRSRWIDGSTHLWTQRRRKVGAGESQSGLQFDQARPNDA